MRQVQAMLASILLATALFVGPFFVPQLAQAHADAEPIWEMNETELSQLEKSIERHRQNLIAAIDVAVQSGAPVTTDFKRPYFFDSKDEVAEIPRSVLNRVIIESLNLETASAKLYVFCGNSCDRSLFKDLVDDPQRDETLNVVRQLWPKFSSAFAVLWRDIALGVWSRFVHASKYSRAVIASARYKANAYGRFSMMAGATAFGVAFGVTEMAEFLYAGPFHLVCQANYFWSIAVAAAVASFSRDIKTLFLFGKDEASTVKRLSRLFAGFRALHSTQRLEKRILFRTMAGGDEVFVKTSQRDAHTGVLKRWLETPSARQAVAADGLIWAELVSHLGKYEMLNSDTTKTEDVVKVLNRQKLFETEISEIFSAAPESKSGLRRWQDMNASLRTLLRILKNGIDVGHQLHGDRGPALDAAGSLDRQLRTLDVFIQSWILNRATNPYSSANGHDDASKWLRSQVSEWLSIALTVSKNTFDLSQIRTRIELLQSNISKAVNSGTPGPTCRALFLPISP